MRECHKDLQELPLPSCCCAQGLCCKGERPQKTHFIKKYLAMKLMELVVATAVIAVLQPEKFKQLCKSAEKKLSH